MKTLKLVVTITNNKWMILNMVAPIFSSTWIIDFGTIDHIIFDFRPISHLKLSS